MGVVDVTLSGLGEQKDQEAWNFLEMTSVTLKR